MFFFIIFFSIFLYSLCSLRTCNGLHTRIIHSSDALTRNHWLIHLLTQFRELCSISRLRLAFSEQCIRLYFMTVYHDIYVSKRNFDENCSHSVHSFSAAPQRWLQKHSPITFVIRCAHAIVNNGKCSASILGSLFYIWRPHFFGSLILISPAAVLHLCVRIELAWNVCQTNVHSYFIRIGGAKRQRIEWRLTRCSWTIKPTNKKNI